MMPLKFFFCVACVISPILAGPLVNDAAAVANSGTPSSSVAPTPPVADDNRSAKSLDNELYQGGKTSVIEEALLRKLTTKCNQNDPSSCVMLKLITYMNRLLKKSNFEISESVEITQTSPVVEEEIKKEELVEVAGAADESRGFSDESVFGELVTEKIWSFIKSRSLKLKVLPETDVVLSTNSDDQGNVNMGVALRSSRSVETGCGEIEMNIGESGHMAVNKVDFPNWYNALTLGLHHGPGQPPTTYYGRGKNKNSGPLIAMGIMKLGMLKVLAFKALALLVGKALLVSKLAFLLAAVLGLKKLFSQSKHVTYEVVSHPHHAPVDPHAHGDSYSSGWGRSGDAPAAQNLAYRGHLQASS